MLWHVLLVINGYNASDKLPLPFCGQYQGRGCASWLLFASVTSIVGNVRWLLAGGDTQRGEVM